MTNRVVVIGGGASGLVAAIFAAQNGAKVTILEHRDRVGKKLLMTGNGKCNLTNMNDVHGKYYSSDKNSLDKIYDALARFDARETRKFFKSLGLYTKEKRDGGVYPVSEQAAVVVDVLRSACASLNIRIITECEIEDIMVSKKGGQIRARQYLHKEENQSTVISGNEKKKAQEYLELEQKKVMIDYDRLILATGGRAAANSGSDGSGYQFARSFGHHIVKPLPALVQLQCAGDFFRAIAGVRVQSIVQLYVDGSKVAIQDGELQLTDYGISGIPVFQLSRIAARALYDKKTCEVRINFIPFLAKQDMEQLFKKIENEHYQYKTVQELVAGLVHKKLAAMICKQHKIRSEVTINQIKIQEICSCVEHLADFRVHVTGTNSFESAQVCSGGVSLTEVDETFQSKKCKNVYLVGELLDCDGICGGYNLQWAWTTGAIAGKEAAK